MREPKKPKKDRTRRWCSGGGQSYGHLDLDAPVRKKFVRCPECGQRFQATIDRDGIKEKVRGYKTWRVPKHKRYGEKSGFISRQNRMAVTRVPKSGRLMTLVGY